MFSPTRIEGLRCGRRIGLRWIGCWIRFGGHLGLSLREYRRRGVGCSKKRCRATRYHQWCARKVLFPSYTYGN